MTIRVEEFETGVWYQAEASSDLVGYAAGIGETAENTDDVYFQRRDDGKFSVLVNERGVSLCGCQCG